MVFRNRGPVIPSFPLPMTEGFAGVDRQLQEETEMGSRSTLDFYTELACAFMAFFFVLLARGTRESVVWRHRTIDEFKTY